MQLCYYAYFCDPCTTGKKIGQLDWSYSELGKMTDIPTIELNPSSASQENQSSISTEESISTCPRRRAATEARDRIIARIMDNQV